MKMKLRLKTVMRFILKGMALALLLFCAVLMWFMFEIWLPNRTISNPKWGLPDNYGDHVPREKIRNACHKILRRYGTHHNALLTIKHVGNKESIPYLIQSLNLLNLEYPDAATGGFSPCTYGHGVASLQKLTGMEFGIDYEAWKNWWEQTGRYLSFDEEKGQLVLPFDEEKGQLVLPNEASQKQELP